MFAFGLGFLTELTDGDREGILVWDPEVFDERFALAEGSLSGIEVILGQTEPAFTADDFG